MGFFDIMGSWASRFSNSQSDHNFYLVRTPFFKQFLDICVWNYPDPLDLYEWSYEIVPMYFFAGAIDYGIMIFFVTIYSQFSLLFLPRNSAPETATSILLEMQRPQSRSFGLLIFISFVLRTRNLGLGNIQKVCKLSGMQWQEMRKLTVLILLLCPALFWSWFLDNVFSFIGLERNRPWLAQLFWLMLSRDWDVAQYYSGFASSKGSAALKQETAARLNETWTGFIIRCTKITLFATPLEMFVKNLPYMVVGLVFTVGRYVPAMAAFVGSQLRGLHQTAALKWFWEVDRAVSRRRDAALLWFISYLRQARASPYTQRVVIYLGHSRNVFNQAVKPRLLVIWRAAVNSLMSIVHSTKTIILFHLGRGTNTETSSIVKEPIHGHRFRLLRVEPAFSKDDDITCTLAWHRLNSKVSYTAVSYVWGSDKKDCSILLDGKRFQTTTSALVALRGLRSRWRAKMFWIDAICIDQTSDADKGEQISIMADIYRSAAQVTVWLGHDEEGALALSLARRLWIRTTLADAMGFKHHSLDAPEAAWRALRRLLENTWYQRTWVVQEVMSSNIYVQYGDATVEWSILSRFAIGLEADKPSLAKLQVLVEGNEAQGQAAVMKMSYIRVMEEFRSMHAGDDRPLSLLCYLIRMFRCNKFKATNTQDRIYALLNLCGLATDVEFNALLNESELLGYKNPQNTPDYYDRLAAFFTTAARYFATSGPEERRLDFLAHAGLCNNAHSKLPGLPSWVPDWSLDNASPLPLLGYDGTLEVLQHPRLEGLLRSAATLQTYDEIGFNGQPKRDAALKQLQLNATTMLEKTTYRAAKDTLATINLLPGNVLSLKGTSIDRIRALGTTLPLFPNPSNPTKSEIQTLQSAILSWHKISLLCYTHTAPTHTPATARLHLELFERTLLADLSHPTFDFTFLNPPTRPVPPHLLWNAAKLVGLAKGMFTWSTIPGGEESIKTYGEWVENVARLCGGRRFGTTEGGRMGLWDAVCELGDEVVAFEGVGVPFVLRQMKKQGGEQPVGEQSREQDGGTRAGTKDGEGHGDEDGNKGEKFYELVGPAYVHGVMDGEALDQDYAQTTFMIR